MDTRRHLTLMLGAAVLLAAGACGSATAGRYTDDDARQSRTTIADLQISELEAGDGMTATRGRAVRVHYTGWLYHPARPDNKGRKFDSSLDRGQPFEFPLGRGAVIRGWEEGVEGMQVGGRRRLVIPPAKAYGSSGAGEAIPAGRHACVRRGTARGDVGARGRGPHDNPASFPRRHWSFLGPVPGRRPRGVLSFSLTSLPFRRMLTIHD